MPKHPYTIGQGKHDRKVTAFVDAYWKTKYRPPTIREIATACGIPSTSVVLNVLHRLARSDGYTLQSDISRGVVPAWVKVAIESHSTSR